MTHPVEISAGRMLLPVTGRNVSHRDISVRPQRPAPIRLLAPELLPGGWLVWCELTWYLSACSLGNHPVLKVDIGFCGSDEVVWRAGGLRQGSICGCCGGGGLKERGPVAVGARGIGCWLSGGVWVCCREERRIIVRVGYEWLCESVTGIGGGSSAIVRGTVWPTSCGCLRLGVVCTVGVVGGLWGLAMRSVGSHLLS